MARKPETPKEIEVWKKSRRIILWTWLLSIIFYTTIFIIVPKVPNTPFYLALDDFMNNYLFGYIKTRYSSNFYFTMKVAWCLSLAHESIMFLIVLFLNYFYLRLDGIRTMYHICGCDQFTTGTKIGFLFFLILFLNIAFFPYAFVLARAAGAYGSFPMAVFMFYLFTVLCSRVIVYLLADLFYSPFFSKETEL